MKQTFALLLTLGALLFLVPSTFLRAADMQERIHAATQILDQKQHSDEPIPGELLSNAKGVAIFSITKVGLGIGGQGGEGIVLAKTSNLSMHVWSAPSAFNLSGGSIGAQIGYTEVRYIVVLNTEDALRHFSGSGKLDWNGTASGTAGSDSATEKVSTEDLRHRDVVVYKDSSGIFGGATLGGTSVERKVAINQQAYGDDVRTRNILNGRVHRPSSASHLYVLLGGNG